MTKTNSLWLAIAIALPILFGSLSASAQDAAVVNAKTVHVTLENARVRVLEAVVPPGEKEQMHSHPACVIHVIAGGKIRNHTADGKTTESELITGTTLYREPVTHWAENIGTTPIHLVIVELKGERVP